MAFWIDSELASGNDDGTSPANAVRSDAAIRTGFQVGHSGGTIVYVRRSSIYDEAIAAQNADISISIDVSEELPVIFMGWPRAAIPDTTITEGDWTNGDATVDNIVGIICSRLAHCGRFITAPDGSKYLITYVVDTNTLELDREYAGSTVINTNGKFQIEEDEDYADRDADGITAGWDADPHDLPEIDFNNENYNINAASDNYISFRNLAFRDSADTAGIIYFFAGRAPNLLGCLFLQSSSNVRLLGLNTALGSTFNRVIFEGSGSGSSQHGIGAGDSTYKLKNAAIYNCGDIGLNVSNTQVGLENVNLGIEFANGDNDIAMGEDSLIEGVDVKLGGTNGYVTGTNDIGAVFGGVKIENWGKILGEHKSYIFLGTYERIAVTDTNANKKLSDYVLQVNPVNNKAPVIDDLKPILFDGSFELAPGSQTIRFWLYNDTGSTLNDTTAKDNVYLRATYVDSYDDTSKYNIAEVFSSQIDILDAADADDWDYLEVTVNPATASKVRVQLIASVYSAINVILIDPEPVIT